MDGGAMTQQLSDYEAEKIIRECSRLPKNRVKWTGEFVFRMYGDVEGTIDCCLRDEVRVIINAHCKTIDDDHNWTYYLYIHGKDFDAHSSSRKTGDCIYNLLIHPYVSNMQSKQSSELEKFLRGLQ